MLAYVFWHWPRSVHSSAEYEQIQRAFHAALAESASPGFLGSVVFRVDGNAPWLGGAPAYADWYQVDGSAALDPLNVAAVSGACTNPHAAVAHAMAAGAGSLLTLRGQQPNLESARFATWLTKPAGMPYDSFYAEVAPAESAHQTSLWRRQMVLGPTREFGLLSPNPAVLPDDVQPLRLELTPIWSGRSGSRL